MKDLFSQQAATYAGFRPEYPEDLYAFILAHVTVRDAVWDCATGNGQAAKALAMHFRLVEATDISQKQLDHAFQAKNIRYSCQSAEKTNFVENHFDLITVAQALHWFDFQAFLHEAKRVAKPGALLACWGYELLRIESDPVLDQMMQHFYQVTTNAYWEPERRHIENEYAEVPFPFPCIPAPEFAIKVYWLRDEFKGYLKSWSAVQKCLRLHQVDLVDQFMSEIEPLWPASVRHQIRFQVFLKMGRL